MRGRILLQTACHTSASDNQPSGKKFGSSASAQESPAYNSTINQLKYRLCTYSTEIIGLGEVLEAHVELALRACAT